jgi:hypothetical protein
VAVKTLDVQTFLETYIVDLNEATENRDFDSLVGKWFAPECSLTFFHDTQGIEEAKKLWQQLLPKGEKVPRDVIQNPYKVENGRVYSMRILRGGIAPKPLYGLQETQFDENDKISEISIKSQQSEPQVEEEPDARTSHHGKLFMQFADVFNQYFIDGNPEPVEKWCTSDVHMILESSFWNQGVVKPHHRIPQRARFKLRDWEQTSDERIKASVDFKAPGELDAITPWEVALTPDGKIRELRLSLQMA